jgi:hypothetical protein
MKSTEFVVVVTLPWQKREPPTEKNAAASDSAGSEESAPHPPSSAGSEHPVDEHGQATHRKRRPPRAVESLPYRVTDRISGTRGRAPLLTIALGLCAGALANASFGCAAPPPAPPAPEPVSSRRPAPTAPTGPPIRFVPGLTGFEADLDPLRRFGHADQLIQTVPIV